MWSVLAYRKKIQKVLRWHHPINSVGLCTLYTCSTLINNQEVTSVTMINLHSSYGHVCSFLASFLVRWNLFYVYPDEPSSNSWLHLSRCLSSLLPVSRCESCSSALVLCTFSSRIVCAWAARCKYGIACPSTSYIVIFAIAFIALASPQNFFFTCIFTKWNHVHPRCITALEMGSLTGWHTNLPNLGGRDVDISVHHWQISRIFKDVKNFQHFQEPWKRIFQI